MTSISSLHYLEIVTPDVNQTADIYRSQFGWHFEEPVAELGNARVAKISGGSRCGIRAPMSPEESPKIRIYLKVDSIAEHIKHLSDSNAEILLERMDIPGHGTIAIYQLGGIEHGLWELN